MLCVGPGVGVSRWQTLRLLALKKQCQMLLSICPSLPEITRQQSSSHTNPWGWGWGWGQMGPRGTLAVDPGPPSGSGLRASWVMGKSKGGTVGNRPPNYRHVHTVQGARGPLAWDEGHRARSWGPCFLHPSLCMKEHALEGAKKKKFLSYM